MSTEQDINNVKANITKIFEERKVKLLALSLSYAGKAVNLFRQRQTGDEYWTNQTGQALSRAFSNAFQTKNEIGFFLSHGVDYGVYLELANDRAHEAIRPIIQELAPKFFKDVKEII